MSIDIENTLLELMSQNKEILDIIKTIEANTTKKPRVKKEATPEKIEFEEQFKAVIDMYNDELNKSLKYSKCHKTPIMARLRSGFVLEDFRKVINNKRHDEFFVKNPQYMMPQTLFGEKMDKYLACGKIENNVDINKSYENDLLFAMEEEGL